jgi:hypothetical protein
MKLTSLKLTKPYLKQIPIMTNHYGTPGAMFQQHDSWSRNWPRPTFSKETLTKKPLHEADQTHIFGTNPNCITPNQSFEESDTTMNVSISASASSWTILTEKRRTSFSSRIGLPSEYPSPTIKSKRLASSILSEELEDFDGTFDDSSYEKDLDTSFFKVDQIPLKDDAASSQQKPTSRRSRHRRQRSSEIISTDSYREMMMTFNQRKRRRKHHALCAKDFHEKILEALVPADFSVEASSAIE